MTEQQAAEMIGQLKVISTQLETVTLFFDTVVPPLAVVLFALFGALLGRAAGGVVR